MFTLIVLKISVWLSPFIYFLISNNFMTFVVEGESLIHPSSFFSYLWCQIRFLLSTTAHVSCWYCCVHYWYVYLDYLSERTIFHKFHMNAWYFCEHYWYVYLDYFSQKTIFHKFHMKISWYFCVHYWYVYLDHFSQRIFFHKFNMNFPWYFCVYWQYAA